MSNSPENNADDQPDDKLDDEQQDELQFNNTPNILTSIRVLFVPIVVGFLFLREPQWDLIAAVTFGVAAITDYFDGYIARTRKQVTVYGKLMDPLADKFLVVSSLIMLQHLERIHPIIVMLLICRELAITGLRALASSEGLIIAASGSAKWKTATQMVAIPFLMVRQGLFGIPLFEIGLGLTYISLALSLQSAGDYVVGFFRAIAEKRRKRKEERLARNLARKRARSEKK